MIVQIPDDVSTYEPKPIGNFTTRQIVCLLLCLAVVAGVFIPMFLLTGDINVSGLVACILGVPIVLFGVVKRDGLRMEQVIKLKAEAAAYPARRPYRMHNWYEDLELAAKEVSEIEAGIEKDQGQKWNKRA